MAELQQRRDRRGQFLPGIRVHDPADLAPQAEVKASSELVLHHLPPNQEWMRLDSG